MRHSDIRLTMGAYTDPALLDQRAAVEALPRISLEAHPGRPPLAAGRSDEPTVKPTGPTITLHESWRDFLVCFLVSSLAEQGSPIKHELTSDGTEPTEAHTQVLDVKSERAATYGRSCHSLAALAALYPQGDLNPCLQDENLIS